MAGGAAASAAASGRQAGSAPPPRRLAFVYHPFSFGALELAAAAGGVCDLVWVVDSSMPDVELMSKLLRRLGTVVDVAGVSAQQAAARIAPHAPDGILALADSLLDWTAEVATRLGLRFHTPEVAARLTDKYLQPRALAAAGVPAPEAWPLPVADDSGAWDELAAVRFPAVLKPRRGEGSRDVIAVGSLGELRTRVAELEGPRSREWVVQRYLPDRPGEVGEFADYVSVESIVSAGTISHLALTGRTPVVPPFRESGFFIPAALQDGERDAVLALASRAIEALGVLTGTLHTEIKQTAEGPCVIEVNGRLGGGTSAMLASVTDVELLPIALRLALGESITFEKLLRPRGVAFVLYVHAPVAMRRIVAVEGIEQLRADPCVDQVILNRGPGQSVDWRDGSWGHVFAVHGTTRDHAELAALAARIRAQTRVLGE